MLHPRYSTRAAAVAAIDCGYSESIGGDYPATWRSATRSIEQVGESHWWVVDDCYGSVEQWISRELVLWHIYAVNDGRWIVVRWSGSEITRTDCPQELADMVRKQQKRGA